MKKILDIVIIISCFLPIVFSLFLGLLSLLTVVFSINESNPLFKKNSFIINIWSSATAISIMLILLLWIAMILNCIYYLTTSTDKKLVYTKWLILLIFLNFFIAPIYYFKKYKKHNCSPFKF